MWFSGKTTLSSAAATARTLSTSRRRRYGHFTRLPAMDRRATWSQDPDTPSMRTIRRQMHLPRCLLFSKQIISSETLLQARGRSLGHTNGGSESLLNGVHIAFRRSSCVDFMCFNCVEPLHLLPIHIQTCQILTAVA